MIEDNESDILKTWAACNIGDSGARMIGDSLKTNTTLTYLGLNGDEKWSKMKWIIIAINNTKEWKKWKI